jgi:uncharacterized tellurite resistance protein B-like protein
LSLLRFLGLGETASAREKEPASLVEIGRELESLPPDEARFIAAFGYILARVAAADLSTEDVEKSSMIEHLQDFASIEPEQAPLLAEAAIRATAAHSPSDDHLVARAFRDMSDDAERIRLLRCLYAVAAADEHISTVEDNEIFEVAAALGVRRPDVVAVRSAFKQYLGALRALPTED